jgi:small subunit ribosomal protein S6
LKIFGRSDILHPASPTHIERDAPVKPKDQRRFALKRPYESIVIFDGTLSEDAISGESGKIQEFLSKNAQFESTVVWGKRHLAYSIKKKKVGIYHLFLYQGEGNVAAKLDKFLKLNESVLRHLSVVRVDRPVKPAITAPSTEVQA